VLLGARLIYLLVPWYFGLGMLQSRADASVVSLRTCSDLLNETSDRIPSLDSTSDLGFLTRQIQSYQTLMALPEIGDKPIHLDKLKNQFARLSVEAKAEVLSLIRDTYLYVKVFKYFSGAPVKKAKRHFDVILSESSGSFEFFKNSIYRDLRGVEETLQDYFNQEAERIQLPKAVDVENVLYVAYKIQDQFRYDKRFATEKVYLYGSFVNGRGITKLSDLDFAIENAILASKVENLKMTFPELSQFILSDAQAHMARRGQSHEYGYMNPVVIVIHQSTIEVRVYKSQNFQATTSKPRFMSFYL
jgi:hypothetical protein